jgi:hypothetical protein
VCGVGIGGEAARHWRLDGNGGGGVERLCAASLWFDPPREERRMETCKGYKRDAHRSHGVSFSSTEASDGGLLGQTAPTCQRPLSAEAVA